MNCDIWYSKAGPGRDESVKPRFQRQRVVSLSVYWYRSKGNWLRYNLGADSFYIMKLCSRLLVLYCRNCQSGNSAVLLYKIWSNYKEEKLSSMHDLELRRRCGLVSNYFDHLLLYIGWSDVTYLWPQCDRHFVGQHVVLCVVKWWIKWWRFVALFEWNWISWFKKMSVLSLSYWESDVRTTNKLAPQNGGKQLIWRNYVTVTLCIALSDLSALQHGPEVECLIS